LYLRLFEALVEFDGEDFLHNMETMWLIILSLQAFVSEYAVTVNSGHGNLVAALAEGAFLIGIELNRFEPSHF
jgi:hypothetical protein